MHPQGRHSGEKDCLIIEGKASFRTARRRRARSGIQKMTKIQSVQDSNSRPVSRDLPRMTNYNTVGKAGHEVKRLRCPAYVPFFPFNAAERNVWMRMKVTHCLSPDLLGRVCGTAADNRCAREAEGQVEGSLSFASFSLAVKENEDDHQDRLSTYLAL